MIPRIPGEVRGERADAARALVWLLSGVAGFVIVLMLVTPELVWGAGGKGRRVLAELAVIIGLAAIPGILAVVAMVRYRRRRDRQE